MSGGLTLATLADRLEQDPQISVDTIVGNDGLHLVPRIGEKSVSADANPMDATPFDAFRFSLRRAEQLLPMPLSSAIQSATIEAGERRQVHVQTRTIDATAQIASANAELPLVRQRVENELVGYETMGIAVPYNLEAESGENRAELLANIVQAVTAMNNLAASIVLMEAKRVALNSARLSSTMEQESNASRALEWSTVVGHASRSSDSFLGYLDELASRFNITTGGRLQIFASSPDAVRWAARGAEFGQMEIAKNRELTMREAANSPVLEPARSSEIVLRTPRFDVIIAGNPAILEWRERGNEADLVRILNDIIGYVEVTPVPTTGHTFGKSNAVEGRFYEKTVAEAYRNCQWGSEPNNLSDTNNKDLNGGAPGAPETINVVNDGGVRRLAEWMYELDIPALADDTWLADCLKCMMSHTGEKGGMTFNQLVDEVQNWDRTNSKPFILPTIGGISSSYQQRDKNIDPIFPDYDQFASNKMTIAGAPGAARITVIATGFRASAEGLLASVDSNTGSDSKRGHAGEIYKALAAWETFFVGRHRNRNVQSKTSITPNGIVGTGLYNAITGRIFAAFGGTSAAAGNTLVFNNAAVDITAGGSSESFSVDGGNARSTDSFGALMGQDFAVHALLTYGPASLDLLTGTTRKAVVDALAAIGKAKSRAITSKEFKDAVAKVKRDNAVTGSSKPVSIWRFLQVSGPEQVLDRLRREAQKATPNTNDDNLHAALEGTVNSINQVVGRADPSLDVPATIARLPILVASDTPLGGAVTRGGFGIPTRPGDVPMPGTLSQVPIAVARREALKNDTTLLGIWKRIFYGFRIRDGSELADLDCMHIKLPIVPVLVRTPKLSVESQIMSAPQTIAMYRSNLLSDPTNDGNGVVTMRITNKMGVAVHNKDYVWGIPASQFCADAKNRTKPQSHRLDHCAPTPCPLYKDGGYDHFYVYALAGELDNHTAIPLVRQAVDRHEALPWAGMALLEYYRALDDMPFEPSTVRNVFRGNMCDMEERFAYGWPAWGYRGTIYGNKDGMLYPIGGNSPLATLEDGSRDAADIIRGTKVRPSDVFNDQPKVSIK